MKKKFNPSIRLLVVIYLAFISLGIPDGILGVAWPDMRRELSLPLEMMGVLTTSLLFCSAFSSVISPVLQRKIGTSKITFISCFMTGAALGGYVLSNNLYFLILCTIPLGLGQGAVDSVLNNYVAENYTSKHMNWLHCFWGIGASLGPILITLSLSNFGTWRVGYGSISIIQLILALLLFISLVTGMWKIEEVNRNNIVDKVDGGHKLSGKLDQGCAILQFFLYTGIEFSTSAWISSVLVEGKGLTLAFAGIIAAIYYGAIMIGRFLSGLIVNKYGNMKLLRGGICIAVIGGLILFFVPGVFWMNLIGAVIFGLGLAPLYPCLMHETPSRFKESISSRLIGCQVGAACMGGSLVSSGIGLFLAKCSLKGLFPILLILILVYFILNEHLHRKLMKYI